MKKTYLLLGSGGREHAIAVSLSKSSFCKKLWIAPGNPGTASVGTNVNLNILSSSEILDFCQKEQIDIVIVGPEAPLMEGIADELKKQKIHVVGPTKQGALLEGSKEFAKVFMQKYHIPTATYESFHAHQISEAKEFMQKLSFPLVIKASGLAAGKGVFIVHDFKEAAEIVDNLLAGKSLGEAGKTIIIEEFLDGIELSIFVLTDGKNWILLPEAKDYKRIFDNDEGPNTGGMGSISPVPFFNFDLKQKVIDKIILPTVRGLSLENIDYQGFLFIGLMIVKSEPFVLEYNVRMGDPETQSVFSRITSDTGEMFWKTATGSLNEYELQVTENKAATLVLVSNGYPGNFPKGMEILIPEPNPEVFIFHAGTAEKEQKIVTNGGRVLGITSLANDLDTAIKAVYETAENIQYEGKFYRKDIGKDILSLEKKL